ncbi:MAG: alpha/beta fold hydrolase [Rhodothermales bacterium]|nr:alpha/beta fold hydrolase [Rhodothermales bacterium]
MWFFHGNLQTPAAWNGIADELNTAFPNVDCRTPDWTITDSQTLQDAARSFCSSVRESNHYTINVVVGYSMGGRFAFHLLLEDPTLWTSAIIASADPGTEVESERQSILQRDMKWAAELRSGDLGNIVEAWDSLPVFGDRPNAAPRELADLDAERLAESMVRFSKGKQESLWSMLAELKTPTTFVSGSEDKRYSAIGTRLASTSEAISHHNIRGAGHRVPWEAQAEFVDLVRHAIAQQ